jgi:hypothetical protein
MIAAGCLPSELAGFLPTRPVFVLPMQKHLTMWLLISKLFAGAAAANPCCARPR